MNLVDQMPSDPHQMEDLLPRLLPDLSKLTNLTALNLAENQLCAFPAALEKMPHLRFLDLSGNEQLQASFPS